MAEKVYKSMSFANPHPPFTDGDSEDGFCYWRGRIAAISIGIFRILIKFKITFHVMAFIGVNGSGHRSFFLLVLILLNQQE